MGRAHAIAMCDGGKPLHVDAEQTGKSGSLNLADLWKALGHVRNRAVMLAQLFTDRRRQRRSNVPVLVKATAKAWAGVLSDAALAIRSL
jgi:hypothetical protein